MLSEQVGDSRAQIRRYIRLTELIPELLEYLDLKRIQFTSAVEISYLDKEIQKWMFEYIRDNGLVKPKQIALLRKMCETGIMTEGKLIAILNDSQPGRSIYLGTCNRSKRRCGKIYYRRLRRWKKKNIFSYRQFQKNWM